MKTTPIGSRSIIFTFESRELGADWDLNLHLIMGNAFNFIIDPGLGNFTVEPMIAYASARNDLPFVIINTHYHWDHTWANDQVENALIIGHTLCGEKIEANWTLELERNKYFVREPRIKVLPNLTFEDALYFPVDKIKLIHTPGHSSDCISIVDELDGIINMGDNIGDTMAEIVPYLECDRATYRLSLLKCKGYHCHTIVTGHNQILESEIIDKIVDLL